MGTKEIIQIKSWAIKLISIYPRTQYELFDKLKKKNYQINDIEHAIIELKEKGYLDDQAYAKKWLDKRLKYRPCGRLLCRAMLLRKGVEEDIVEQLLAENYSYEKELELAQLLAEKKKQNLNQLKSEAVKKKIIYFLNNKGFSAEVIMQIIK